MKRYQKLIQPGSVSVSNSVMTRTEFEFNTGIISVPSNDVVFCGKVITRKSEPGSAPQLTKTEEEKSSDRKNVFVAGLRSPSGREKRWRRSGSNNKSYTGMFGTVKFPLQMDLSDIKMRQEKREAMAAAKLPAEGGVRESCWELVRPLRRRGSLLRSLKSSFRCISMAIDPKKRSIYLA